MEEQLDFVAAGALETVFHTNTAGGSIETDGALVDHRVSKPPITVVLGLDGYGFGVAFQTQQTSRGLRDPEESARHFGLITTIHARRIVCRSAAEEHAPLRVRMVGVCPGVDQEVFITDRQPNRQRIRMAVRGGT